MNLWFPVPRQQFVETIDGMPGHHPREHVAQVGVRFDAFKLAAFDKRAENGPTMAAAIAPGEEVILAAQCHWGDRSLDRIGVELDSSIVQEPCQAVPTRQRVMDRFGKRATAWNPRQLRFEPAVKRLDRWTIGEPVASATS